MILVTGGAGYIGSVTVERLIEQGREVAVFDSLERGHRDAVHPRARLIQADLANRDALERVFAELPVSAVVHFAAYAQVGESMSRPELYFRNNFSNALNLLEAAIEGGVERFVFSSTCAIFGDRVPVPIPEAADRNPINPYGESKLCFERALEWSRRAGRLPSFFALRYFNACGATAERGERHEPETHLIPLVLEAAAGERPSIAVFGTDYPTPDGSCVRDYVHVVDLADAHLAALDAAEDQSGGYNVGVGRGHSVLEVIEVARRVTGRAIRVETAPRRPGDPPELRADPTKIERELGWRARLDLAAAVESAWAFKERSRA